MNVTLYRKIICADMIKLQFLREKDDAGLPQWALNAIMSDLIQTGKGRFNAEGEKVMRLQRQTMQ